MKVWNIRSNRILTFSKGLGKEAAVLKEVLHSIGYFTTYQPLMPEGHTPEHLLPVEDIHRYGMFSFAFDSPYLHLVSKTSNPRTPVQSELTELVFACTQARMDFMQRYTILDQYTQPPLAYPSRALLLGMVYLHNLWVLSRQKRPQRLGLTRREFRNWTKPMAVFIEKMGQPNMQLSASDTLTLHVAVCRLLRLLDSDNADSGETDLQVFSSAHHQYKRLQETYPFIAVLLDQLIQHLPLSRLWFLSVAPYHIEENHAHWLEKSMSLFSRDQLPVLQVLADHLSYSVFEHGGNMLMFNPHAVRLLYTFFQKSSEKSYANPYTTCFRLMVYYYLEQADILTRLERALLADSRQIMARTYGLSTTAVSNILALFLAQTAWIPRQLPLEGEFSPGDMMHYIQHMINPLATNRFPEKCQFMAGRLSKNALISHTIKSGT